MLQRDDAAHVVADAASGLTAYAVFEPGAKLPAAGRLVAADRPTLFLYREAGDGLEVTLCDPELHYARNRYPVVYAPVTTSLLVRGARTAPALPAGVTVADEGDDTRVTFASDNAVEKELRLVPRRR